MATITSSSRRYGPVAVFFHWASAALFLALATLGQIYATIPRETRSFWLNVHALFGLIFLALVIARLTWRLGHAPPTKPGEVNGLVRIASSVVHWAMYILMIFTPVIGVIAFIWHGRVLELGIVQIDFGIQSTRAIYHSAQNLHGWLVYVLLCLAIGHTLIAIHYYLFGRRDVLSSMAPWIRAA